MLETAQQGVHQFAEAAQRLSSMRVGAGRLREVRQDVLPRLPMSLWGKVLDRFLLHEQLDGFGLLNARTNVLWHDEKPTASTFSWNEYLTTGLVEHALGETLHARRN